VARSAPRHSEPTTSGGLPWVSKKEESAGVGICLSGGGLRAASFAYGAVQALQKERDLLYGPTCADHLAVVSGGSYLAAALALNSMPLDSPSILPPEPAEPPMKRGTPEANHVGSHGTYFKNARTGAKIAGFLVVNLLAFALMFYFLALGLVVIAEFQEEVLGIELPLRDAAGLYAVALAALLLGGHWWLRGLYRVAKRSRLIAAGVFVLIVGAPSIAAASQRLAADWTWLGLTVVVLILYAFAAAILWLGMGVGDSPVWRPVGWAGARIPAIAGLALFCVTTSELAGKFELGDGVGPDDVALALTLAFSVAVSWLAGRVSLHRLYRNRLATCFSVRRADSYIIPIGDTATKISATCPPAREQATSFPRLLVCATANVFWDPEHNERQPTILHPIRRRRFASFVYSHDRCGIPEVADAWFETSHLEELTTHASVRGDREPLVSVMTAVASTGAAVSPAMGRKTSSFLRTICALTNVRLGRWLPNPMSEIVRHEVKQTEADALTARRRVFGSGFNEFVPELFGLHRADSPRVYVSDGGHYDNLGLIALLHARCKVIWCVDAQADIGSSR
jgi:hypothetical protein